MGLPGAAGEEDTGKGKKGKKADKNGVDEDGVIG